MVVDFEASNGFATAGVAVAATDSAAKATMVLFMVLSRKGKPSEPRWVSHLSEWRVKMFESE